MDRIFNLIDGRWVPPASGSFLDNVEPATGQTVGQIAASHQRDIDAAVAAAHKAFPAWSRTTPQDRSRCLLRMAELMEARQEELAQAESRDTGKPLALARRLDIPRAIQNLRFFATAILHTCSQSHATGNAALNYTLHRPLGVVGLISPWNLPLYLLTWKAAPALATGNTAVAKPSELTPVTANILGRISQEAELPSGVLNIVHGQGGDAGAALVAHPQVPAVSFTGGTSTGRAIALAAAPRFKKLALEMGGKNPNIIFADADLDEALPGSLRAAFSNQGQICLCGSRILVERPIFEPFVERLVEAARTLKVGDPLDEATQQGALISAAHRDKVLSYISLAREEGAAILCGGAPPPHLPPRCREGFFLTPTILTGLPASSRVNREEIFGPVATVMPFTGEAEAVRMANDTDYGLSASLWTRDLDRAHRVAGQIQAGTVWVNCWMLRDLRVPFGGTKQSGLGREGGEEALRFFTDPSNICIRLARR
ncbi:MAG: aldehyde dehydrogenase [Acidobacteriota bacterium]